MGIFLIVMGIIFLVLVYRNMKAGLDKDWLVWTLTTIGVLIGALYLSSYIDCRISKSGNCGMLPTLIWIYTAPIALCMMQFVYLKRGGI